MASVISGIKYVEGRLWELNTAAQAMLFNLLIINNRLGNSGWLQVSDRRLRELTNAKSNETITRAKRELRDKGFIEYETTDPRAETRYELLFYTREPVQKSVQVSVQEPVHVSVQNSNSLLTRARKTLEPPPSPPPAKSPDNLTISTNEDGLESKMDEVVDGWREDTLMPVLHFEQESKLRAMVQNGEATPEQIAQAISVAKERNSPDEYGHRGLNFNFVMSQLVRILKGDKKRKAYVARPKKIAWKPAQVLTSTKSVEAPLTAKVDVPLTTKADVPLTTKADVPLTTKAEIPLTTKVEAPLTAKADVPLTTKADVPLTTKADVPLTTKAEIPLTTKVEAPLTAKVEAPLTAEEVKRAAEIRTKIQAYKQAAPKKPDLPRTFDPLADPLALMGINVPKKLKEPKKPEVAPIERASWERMAQAMLMKEGVMADGRKVG